MEMVELKIDIPERNPEQSIEEICENHAIDIVSHEGSVYSLSIPRPVYRYFWMDIHQWYKESLKQIPVSQSALEQVEEFQDVPKELLGGSVIEGW